MARFLAGSTLNALTKHDVEGATALLGRVPTTGGTDDVVRFVSARIRQEKAEKVVASVRVWRRVFQGEDVPARVELVWQPRLHWPQ